jgi:hypothetical protein
MNGLLRRVRGAIGLGAVWSLPWAATYAAMGMLYYFLVPWRPPQPETLPSWVGVGAAAGALLGFVTGAIFSGILALAERRGAIATLKPWRVALWGGAAGMGMALVRAGLVSALVGPIPWGLSYIAWNMVQPAAMGALCAALTLRFAKSAGSSEPEGIRAADPAVLRSPDLLDDLQLAVRFEERAARRTRAE